VESAQAAGQGDQRMMFSVFRSLTYTSGDGAGFPFWFFAGSFQLSVVSYWFVAGLGAAATKSPRATLDNSKELPLGC
jgi:hypothetical protein